MLAEASLGHVEDEHRAATDLLQQGAGHPVGILDGPIIAIAIPQCMLHAIFRHHSMHATRELPLRCSKPARCCPTELLDLLGGFQKLLLKFRHWHGEVVHPITWTVISELMILLQQLLSILFEAMDVVRAEEKRRRGAVLLQQPSYFRDQGSLLAAATETVVDGQGHVSLRFRAVRKVEDCAVAVDQARPRHWPQIQGGGQAVQRLQHERRPPQQQGQQQAHGRPAGG
mmetsp:Transcript_51459/g.82236  ORF Transcript_51459/g.82236 Transcript_51459/m.82236 type:complete len:228 (+) Transcript_51459:420-1103(+)